MRGREGGRRGREGGREGTGREEVRGRREGGSEREGGRREGGTAGRRDTGQGGGCRRRRRRGRRKEGGNHHVGVRHLRLLALRSRLPGGLLGEVRVVEEDLEDVRHPAALHGAVELSRRCADPANPSSKLQFAPYHTSSLIWRGTAEERHLQTQPQRVSLLSAAIAAPFDLEPPSTYRDLQKV